MRGWIVSLFVLLGCDGEALVGELCDEAADNGCLLLDAPDPSEHACKAAFERARKAHDPGCNDAFDQWVECVEEEVDNAKACLTPAQLEQGCAGQVRALASCDETYAR